MTFFPSLATKKAMEKGESSQAYLRCLMSSNRSISFLSCSGSTSSSSFLLQVVEIVFEDAHGSLTCSQHHRRAIKDDDMPVMYSAPCMHKYLTMVLSL